MRPAPPSPRPVAARSAGIRHLPGLDGLRGFAVLGVLLFHGGISWAVGGYLGVSLFFTLSGFLICSLLLAERAETGQVRLRSFWERRLRRLLPAALITLVLVVLYAQVAATAGQQIGLSGDIRSALFDFSNWHFLSTGHSYSDLFRDPSLVQHYWSLSIEEQFYLVLPVVITAVLVWGRRSVRFLGCVLVGVAAMSLAVQLMSDNPDRIYYGTDARAFELLSGALLAVALARWMQQRPRAREPSVAWAPVGLAAAGVTLWWWSSAPQTSGWLYDGGFAVVACMNVVVILGTVVPGPLRWVCSLSPIRYVGRISYGIYLYHWPVYLWLDGARTGLDGTALLFVRLAVTFALAVASFHFVEWPIRMSRHRLRLTRVVPAVAGVLVVVTALTIVAVPTPDAGTVITAEDFHVADKIPDAAPPPGVESAVRPLRVYVAGDSTGVMLAGGMFNWTLGSGSGQVVLRSAAGIGCGLLRFGEFRGGALDGVLKRDPAECDHEPERWARDIAEFQPDLVLMSSGPFNVLPYRPYGDSQWRAIGDPVVDEQLRAEMSRSIDILGSTGKPVLWFDVPYSDRPGWDVDARVDRFNALLDELVRARPDVSRLPWAQYVNALPAPDARILRPDLVHVDPTVWPRILDQWLWKEIEGEYHATRARLAATALALS
jgi:peptidoglycan/LPS O-acetylase OafA/YrhL